MKHYKAITSMLAFVLVFTVAVAIAADTPKLTFKFTKDNVPGARQTMPYGISNAGVTVGQYQDTSGVSHGYILNGKTLTALDDPNGSNTIAGGLPYKGVIPVVGYYTNSAGAYVGFLYDDKTKQFTDIPGPAGAIASGALGINDKGEIVGAYEDSSKVWHGFLLQGSNYATLDVPGATYTQADGINDRGHIVLMWTDSSGFTQSSLYKHKKYKTIDVPGVQNSWAGGINNDDDVVFQWWGFTGLTQGALCTKCNSGGRKYYKFDYPKATQTYGWGINDKQTISGGYQPYSTTFYSGYKATY
jgi:uncharacterized membrane protein